MGTRVPAAAPPLVASPQRQGLCPTLIIKALLEAHGSLPDSEILSVAVFAMSQLEESCRLHVPNYRFCYVLRFLLPFHSFTCSFCPSASGGCPGEAGAQKVIVQR